MSSTNTDHTDLNAVLAGGVVREDVMQKIFDISKIDLEFTSRCKTATSKNQYREFVVDDLGEPATDNAVVDGADITGNDVAFGERQGNYHQTAVKTVQISTRAGAVDSIGSTGKVSEQLNRAGNKLRRDVEAQMMTNQASVAGDGDTVAGISAGAAAQIATNTISTVGDYAAGGFNTTTKIIDAGTPGTLGALQEDKIKALLQAIYIEGGNPRVAMSVPGVIGGWSEYQFTDGARVAGMVNDNAKDRATMTAYGSSLTYVGDFSSVDLVANRLQPLAGVGTANLFFFDFGYINQSFITGYKAEPLGKSGLSTKMMISCDYSLLITNEKSQGMYADVDIDGVMTAAG